MSLLLWCQAAYASQVMPIPDPIAQQAFLLNGWRADRPNLLIFKDPFCPYCIKAIPKLERLVGYNIYLFWAPILGNRSQQRVTQFFKCDRPVSESIMQAVVQGNSPACNQPIQQNLMQQNNDYLDAYQINSVPSFYLQGQKVSLAQLLKYQQSESATILGVKPDWTRFNHMQQLPAWQSKNLLLFIAEKDINKADELLNQYQPEYLITSVQVLQKHPKLLGCNHNKDACFSKRIKTYHQQKALFMLMFGDKLDLSQSLLFAHNGKHNLL
ncbi:thioredoxin fold domain-containing protein [Catenovulum sediminis]|uniref:thioredoxin fold domain-containing protein n=1 Tax=Catenovulum sediminis TaxID=1740262 RepID=UPI00117D4829|nr:thioredoxin fold domain-containing protein [Catenovulum sediminis]